MIYQRLSRTLVSSMILLGAVMCAGTLNTEAQSTRRTRPSIPIPAPTATPPVSDPMIISRADEFPDDGSRVTPAEANQNTPADAGTNTNLQSLEDLGRRIRNLEAARKPDPDEKQKRLLLNLDILTRAEQRSESLRKQLFEMIEKENAVKTKLDTLEFELRPDVIERSTAIIGSLRPEEIRASRRRSLEAEKANLQTLLTEIQKNKGTLELNLQRADLLVERLRVKLEKEIDSALEDDPEKENRDN